MPRKAPIPECSELDRKILEQWARSRTEESRLVERAKIILKCLRGERVLSIARDLKVRPNTVIEWRRRFEKQGVQGLKDRPRTGKPLHYETGFGDGGCPVYHYGLIAHGSAAKKRPLACEAKPPERCGLTFGESERNAYSYGVC